MHKARSIVLALLLALLLGGCEGFEDPTPEPGSRGRPTTTPEQRSGGETRRYNGQGWRVEYDEAMLQPEELDEGLTLFISEDRATFFAVDTYEAEGDEFGNTGENLRNRARDTLLKIYGDEVEMVDVIPAEPGSPWDTGFSFKTAKGSQGEALYEQEGRNEGDFKVHGVLFGYKAADGSSRRETLEAMRSTFEKR